MASDLHNLALLDVHLVHPRLVSTADDEVNSQVMKMLLKLGVKQLTPYDVIQYHIMPQLQAQRWEVRWPKTALVVVVVANYL